MSTFFGNSTLWTNDNVDCLNYWNFDGRVRIFMIYDRQYNFDNFQEMSTLTVLWFFMNAVGIFPLLPVIYSCFNTCKCFILLDSSVRRGIRTTNVDMWTLIEFIEDYISNDCHHWFTPAHQLWNKVFVNLYV